MSSIRAILFDQEGTLETVYYNLMIHLSGALALWRKAREAGTKGNFLRFARAALHGTRRYFAWRARTCRELDAFTMWRDFILAELECDQGKLAAIAQELASLAVARFAYRAPRQGAVQVLGELRRRGYKLGLVSDAVDGTVFQRSLAGGGLAEFFPVVVRSGDVGFCKPAPQIFQRALERLGVEPQEAAYVGDRPAADVAGAKRLGMVSVLIPSFETYQRANASPVLPDYTISQLSDLLALFPGV